MKFGCSQNDIKVRKQINDNSKRKIGSLREKMADYKMDMYLIGSEDFHGSEYVGEHFKCRAFISGFTGSAGTVL